MSKDQRRPRLNSTRRPCKCGSGLISRMQTLPGGGGMRESCDACAVVYRIDPKPIRNFGTAADKRRGAARRELQERRERVADEW